MTQVKRHMDQGGQTQDRVQDSGQINLDESVWVLVVDDEKSICHTMGQILEDDGYRVLFATDGAQAIELVQRHSPAMAFVDIWMPGIDGIETLEGIKECSPATEVVMISGHATVSNALEATKRGAFDVIEKPLDLERVLDVAAKAVRSCLDNRLSQQALGSTDVSINQHLSAAEGRVYSLHKHKGICSRGLAGRNLGQRTLCSSTIVYGQGLHSGAKSGLVLEPLPRDSGIHFASMGGGASVPAFVEHVNSTSFATTIRSRGIAIATVEHLMSALHAYGISNALIKCNGEVPILDGSAKDFCALIEDVGVEEQGGDWFEIAPQEPVVVRSEDGNEWITIEPHDSLEVSYDLRYPEPVGSQYHSVEIKQYKDFVENIAPARTFGFMKDIEQLQKMGLAAGGRLDNFVLIGQSGIVNTSLRFPDELARHKILDIVGDLFMIGRPLRARISAKMTGHSDNIALLKKLWSKVASIE